MSRPSFLERVVLGLHPRRALPGFLLLLFATLLVAAMITAFVVEHRAWAAAAKECGGLVPGSCDADVDREHGRFVTVLVLIALPVGAAAALLLSFAVGALTEARRVRRAQDRVSPRLNQIETWYAEAQVSERTYTEGRRRLGPEARLTAPGVGYLLLGRSGRALYLLGIPLVLLGFMYVTPYWMFTLRAAVMSVPNLSPFIVGFCVVWVGVAVLAEVVHWRGRRLWREDEAATEACWAGVLTEVRQTKLAERA